VGAGEGEKHKSSDGAKPGILNILHAHAQDGWVAEMPGIFYDAGAINYNEGN
jgi:hypothetical protein